MRSRPGQGTVVLVLCALLADPLVPAVITVEGGCALPEAIRAANTDVSNGGCPAGSGADTIVLTADVALFAIEESDDGDNGLPTVTSTITIEGNGHTIERSESAPFDFRILKVAAAGNLTLKNTTVSGGRAAAVSSFEGKYGGAFYNNGRLTLDNSTVASNHAVYGGGAVVNYEASLYSLDSTFELNVAGRAGGAVANRVSSYFRAERSLFENNFVGELSALPGNGYGGAILGTTDGSVVIVDSTLTGNNIFAQFNSYGTAILSSGNLVLSNSTVSLNGTITFPEAGAVRESGFSTLTNVTLSGNRTYALVGDFNANAILIADTDGVNCSASTTITGLNNLADDTSCPGVPASLSGLDPALADNGGPTPTHALLAGSNAIDAAGFCALDADQRGAPRVGACDIGAFEFMGCPVLTLADDTIDDAQTFEECAISAGPNLSVIGPGGDLKLLFGESTAFADGFAVEANAKLTVEHDPSLLLVLDELIEADRERRRLKAASTAPAD